MNERDRDIDALQRFRTALAAARDLGVSQPTVQRAIASGSLPAVRAYGATLVHDDDLADYAARRASRGT